MTAIAPLRPALRDPTATAALRAVSDNRAEPPDRRATPCVRYTGARVRRGSEPLTVTLADWLRSKYGVAG